MHTENTDGSQGLGIIDSPTQQTSGAFYTLSHLYLLERLTVLVFRTLHSLIFLLLSGHVFSVGGCFLCLSLHDLSWAPFSFHSTLLAKLMHCPSFSYHRYVEDSQSYGFSLDLLLSSTATYFPARWISLLGCLPGPLSLTHPQSQSCPTNQLFACVPHLSEWYHHPSNCPRLGLLFLFHLHSLQAVNYKVQIQVLTSWFRSIRFLLDSPFYLMGLPAQGFAFLQGSAFQSVSPQSIHRK